MAVEPAPCGVGAARRPQERMRFGAPIAVMVHVPEPMAGLAWYQAAFPEARRMRTAKGDFEFLLLGAVQIEVVPSDGKVGAGPCGTVVYWSVPDLDAALSWLLAHGATLFRGPMDIENGQRMCQVQDPWGNCIGLRTLGAVA